MEKLLGSAAAWTVHPTVPVAEAPEATDSEITSIASSTPTQSKVLFSLKHTLLTSCPWR